MERHRQRHTEICKLRRTHTLRETPSSRKRHTILSVRYTYTHTLRERNVNKESETHTERDTQTLRERHKLTERQKYTERHTETCKL